MSTYFGHKQLNSSKKICEENFSNSKDDFCLIFGYRGNFVSIGTNIDVDQ